MNSPAQNIVQALGGRGSVCRCPAHFDKNPSLSVTDTDDGDVVVHCFAGCDYRTIKDELRHLGLLPEWQPSDIDPEKQAQLATERRIREKQAEKKKAGQIHWARSVWKEALEGPNSPVEAYLGHRGISSAIPPTLRFHQALKHKGTGLYFGTMVALVTRWPSKELMAIHRTFLQPGGKGKAQVSDPKLMLGPCGGGAVRLAPAGETLAITEGIETGLSVQQATELPTWAALSASGIEALVVPNLDTTPNIRIFADNDTSGRGNRAAENAAERWTRLGHSVRIIMPPVPGTDFNDLLKGGKQ